MSGEHFKEEDVLKAVLEGNDAARRKHARACVACEGEQRWLEDAITNFSSAFRGFAAREQAFAMATSRPRNDRHVAFWVFGFVVAAMAIVLFFALPVKHRRQHDQVTLREQQDAQLLQEIDEEMSSTIPDALEPLTQDLSQSANQTPRAAISQ